MTSTAPGGHLAGRGTRLAGLGALVSGAGSSGDLLGTGAATAALFAAQGGSRRSGGSAAGAYAASKGAVLSMTTDYAYRWGPAGIRVNCLVPGHLNTPMGNQGGAGAREARRKANLLGTEGDAWDLAWAALFLAGPESRFVTGVALPVDAGTTMATGLGMVGRMTS